MKGYAARGVGRTCAIDPAVALAGASIVAAAREVALRFEVASTVRRASPLLGDALAARGVTLGSVLDRIEPPARPNRASWTSDPARWILQYYARSPRLQAWLGPEPSAPLTRSSGERLNLVLHGGCLGLRGSDGRLRVAAAGATTWLGIADDVPDTLMLAMRGRTIDALIDHPLVNGRDYRVVEVARSAVGTVFRVRTPTVRCRAPWTARQALDEGAARLGALMREIEA